MEATDHTDSPAEEQPNQPARDAAAQNYEAAAASTNDPLDQELNELKAHIVAGGGGPSVARYYKLLARKNKDRAKPQTETPSSYRPAAGDDFLTIKVIAGMLVYGGLLVLAAVMGAKLSGRDGGGAMLVAIILTFGGGVVNMGLWGHKKYKTAIVLYVMQLGLCAALGLLA